MRVALELQPCCGNRSGIGMYTYELAKRMKDGDGLEFCGNLFNFLNRNDNSAALHGIGMPVRTAKIFPYGVYRRIWNYLPISYQQLFPGKADLHVFFNYIVPPRIAGHVITTVYDMTYIRYPETMDERNLRRIREGIDYSVARSDRIVTISEFSRQEICTLLDVPEEKISVVYSAPVQTGVCGDWAAVAKKQNITRPYILYVGTIEPRKNLTRLIRAFALLKQRHRIPHQLVLAGGKGWQNAEIYQAVEAAACREDILFTGYISQDEKNALYRNAEAFVFPSLYEGFGMPPLEAMQWECPVVCANTASLPEVVGDAARLVDPLEEEDLAEGLLQVITDKAYAAELVRRGSMQTEKFTWDASAKQLTDACRDVWREHGIHTIEACTLL